MAKLNFEKAMENLEKIVHELESGELALEDALKKFEEGMKVSRQCARKLEESEKKIALLMEKADGTFEEKRIDSDDDFE